MTHMQLGGGIDNAMRALGYQVTGPSDPEDCAAFEVHCPDGVTVLLAKDEFEGWQKADEHWRDSALAKMQIERFSPNNPDLAALSEAATKGDSNALTDLEMALVSLYRAGRLVQIDEGMREATARAEAAEAENVRLREALETIRFEAERENGSWVHLKRCIAVQSAQALGAEHGK